ncbi:MAG: hypothetical protein OXH15_02215 [Gammaproteobacteria bacterium]|nr:hypothetical protein [Gammaproteobacteria bacterium]
MTEPVTQKPSLAEVLLSLEPIEDGFPAVDDPPVRPAMPLASAICPTVSRRVQE